MDRLAAVLSHFRVRAHVFHSGLMCGAHRFEPNADYAVGHLHLLKRGRLSLKSKAAVVYKEPTLLLLTKWHVLQADVDDHAELLCAEIHFGLNAKSPIFKSLPGLLAIRLHEMPALQTLLDLLFEEAQTQHCGRQQALDLYAELILIQVLRFAMDQQLVQEGLLAGLGDPKLARALSAIHAKPGESWDLSKLAEVASMSRSRFSAHFKAIIGQTPNDYLVDWRVSVSMEKLMRGTPLKIVAHEVGYADASALARVFSARLGLAPKAWLQAQS